MITGLAIINEIEDRLGVRQTASLDDPDVRPATRKLLRLLNRVLKSMQRLDAWPLLRQDAEITVVPTLVGEDHFSIAKGSTTLVLGASATGDLVFDETLLRRAVRIGLHGTVYRVVSVEAGTSLTLSKPWVDDTLDDELSAYFFGQDQYALPQDYDRPAGTWESFLAPYGVSPVDPDEFRRRRLTRGGSTLVGNPEVFTIYGMTPSGTRQILHIDPFPQVFQRLTYAYQKDHPEIVTDLDRVLVPAAKQDAVIEGVLYLATRDYTDDSKMEMVLRDYIRAINTATGHKTRAERRMQFSPNTAHRHKSRGQWGRGARINWGTLFDRVDRVGFD